jgi:TolA-binding protein
MKEKALKTYRELNQQYPNSEWSAEAGLRTALLLRQEKRWNEATEELERFIKGYPKSHLFVEASLELGELYLLQKEYGKAAERFEKLVEAFPKHPLIPRAYLGLEEGYRALRKDLQAERILKELLEKFPQNDARFESYLRLGRGYLGEKKFGEAIPAFSNALQSPDERVASEAQFRLGEAYWGTGNRESAILQFSKVVYLYPHRSELLEESLLKLGALYVEEGKPSEAKKVYQKLIEKTKREDRRDVAKRMLDQLEKEMNH